MKKFFIIGFLLAIVSIMATGCSSCQSEKKKQVDGIEKIDSVAHTDSIVCDVTGDYDGVVPDITASVENIIAKDRQAMYNLANGADYRFFESSIKLCENLDSEDCDGKIMSVTNVFQQVIEKEKGYDTKVLMFITTGKGTQVNIYDNAFYIENYPLNDEQMQITFEKAFELMMKANVVKPKSKNCVLRKPIGPTPCNAQYIFGNRRQQVYVDAVTGEVRTKNPAFDGYLGGPLGEWP